MTYTASEMRFYIGEEIHNSINSQVNLLKIFLLGRSLNSCSALNCRAL